MVRFGIALLCLALTASAEVWEFQTPPAATRSFDVDLDWRTRAGCKITVRHLGDLPSEPLLCSVYLIAKNDILIKQRHPLRLNNESQTLELPFDDGHWRCVNARRPLDSDLLHHVRSWGIELFCPSEHNGSLSFSDLRPTGSGNASSPIWRQEYAVIQAPGWLQAKLLPQGSPLYEPAPLELKPVDLRGIEFGSFDRDLSSTRVLRRGDEGWQDTVAPKAWGARLDWTPKWGHFRGIGHYDQMIAWKLEQTLLRHEGEPRPIVLFDDDELDDQGRFNWQDHPENAANGGELRRPLDHFRANSAETFVRQRAEFLWSRFGHLPAVNGLLIDAKQPEPVALAWIAKIVDSLPDTPVFSTNLELLERAEGQDISVSDMPWRIDPELSDGEIDAQLVRGGIEMRSSHSSSIGVAARRPLHWRSADALMVDASSPVRPQDAIKAVCLIRPDNHTVFQSKVRLMREGELNRLVFSLTDPGEWTCLQDPERVFDPADLLNVPGLSMRFFQDEPGPLMVNISRILVQQPFQADLARRPTFAIENLIESSASVSAFERYELRFQLNRAFQNPYDPHEIDVSITLKTPGGKQLSHPGFYMEPRELAMVEGFEKPTPTGESYWCVRVSPHEVGDYRWTVTTTAGAESATQKGTFIATEAKGPGIVRVSKTDSRYLEFSDGSLFFPIGQNLRSPGDTRLAKTSKACGENAAWAEKVGTRAYEKWFGKMAEHGANFARVWMSPWWLGLEWNQDYDGQHGITFYSQDHAARLDRIVELAEENDVYLNLETSNHGAFSVRVDGEWEHSPFNREHDPDGFVVSPSDVFLLERSLDYIRRRQRYTLARWGYSRSIAWWGVVTEGEWVEPYDRTIPWEKHPPLPSGSLAARLDPVENRAAYLNWISDSAAFFRKGGAHGHLASMHFSNPPNGKMVWADPNISVVHNNAYTFFAKISIFWKDSKFSVSSGVADVIPAFCNEYETVADSQPLFVGEWGGHPAVNKASHLQAEFHTGSWALLMTRSAGAAGFWWWNLVDAEEMYPTFSAIGKFMEGEDPRGWSTSTRHCQLRLRNPAPEKWPFWRDALVRCGDRKLWAYVYNHAINMNRSSTPASGFEDPEFEPCGPASVRIPERLQPGDYKIEYFDTFSGKPIGSTTVKITEDHHWIPIRDHRVDIALKMTPIAESAEIHTPPPPPPKPEPKEAALEATKEAIKVRPKTLRPRKPAAE
ncbi:MAG: hypothetical protein ACI8W8_000923 [Rhodothermales bacterium]|jgi:hypothetical protein